MCHIGEVRIGGLTSLRLHIAPIPPHNLPFFPPYIPWGYICPQANISPWQARTSSREIPHQHQGAIDSQHV